MYSSSQYVGVFGISRGLTIKNVILGSSCSITSTSSDSGNGYVGGIIGYCSVNYGACTIENSVNMGSVSFNGNISNSNYLWLGGIAGYLYSSYKYDITVKNCANYGDVTHFGESSTSRIGGIVGYSEGSSSKRVYIYNSLNHGTITHKSTTYTYLYIGGITGSTYYTTIENCVSGGKFSLPTKPSDNNIGSIVGYVNSGTSINYTYFTSDLSGFNKYTHLDSSSSESNTLSYDSTTFELSETVSIGSYSRNSLIGVLNAASDNYTLRDYSHWLLNKENKAVTFTINKNSPFALNSQIILLPSLASEGGMCFDGWYTDDRLTVPLTEFEVTSDTELYGRYCALITVTLDVNGGDELAVEEMLIGCNRVYGDLPTPTRTEATFLGWFNESDCGDKIESGGEVTILRNHTLYAHWSINKYTLTFNFGNGSEPDVRTFPFNTTIAYPTDVEREGYTFSGWDKNITNIPTNNLTITAHWTPNNYTVTFNTNGGEALPSPTKAVTFDTPYGELPKPNRAGYSFDGWFTDNNNESITSSNLVKIPRDHTLHAGWEEVTRDVEIVF